MYDTAEKKWYLWYNGRNSEFERIGLATHDGEDLGFPDKPYESLISASVVKDYAERFNQQDDEIHVQFVPNSEAVGFLTRNIPRFECPDKQLEETYYFRWWTYRKHVKQTPDGFVVSEFLPDVPWARKYNTISCAAAHHFYEGRWLQDEHILTDYARFWFAGGTPRSYSFWAANAIYNYHLVHPDIELLTALYPSLKDNFSQWEAEKRDTTQLFWQIDDRDGMEMSVSGSLAPDGKGYRATINSYMYGEAEALSQIAALVGDESGRAFYRQKADALKELINTRLWDKEAGFYKVIPKNGKGEFSPVREQHGYTPWYFHIAPDAYADAWKQILDKEGFYAPFGPTTVEQRAPEFKISYEGHECQWNGPSWPFSTSITLVGLANLLNDHPSPPLSAKDYLNLLTLYSRSHRLQKEDGSTVPWIDENLNPYTGDWISRTRLKTWKDNTWDASKGGVERGKDYNHSSFCDLVISGLIGIRPQEGNQLTVNPLVPADTWDYFCLDNLYYKGHKLTVLYDKHGTKYKQGKGLQVFVDGQLKGQTGKIEKLNINI
ncbi:MAG: hypothetical protein LBV39_06585 [Bacteroidales bacterium]|jgi:hypothetical protein|nr:hypothetical protein [Bacteroidales bacterium]